MEGKLDKCHRTILKEIRKGEYYTNEVVKKTGYSWSTVSSHLKDLALMGQVEMREVESRHGGTGMKTMWKVKND